MSNHSDKISVAMCTYNGEAYIREQLDSIAGQLHIPDEIVVCDDSSTDGTVQCVEDWSKEHPEIECKIFVNRPALGIIKNFEYAWTQATGDYVLFSDQDDVWYPEKIERTYQEMKRCEQRYGRQEPIVVYADVCVVDQELHQTAASFMRLQGIHHVHDADERIKVLSIQNFVIGCTMMMNAPLKAMATPFPDSIIMHDHWVALVAAAGGQFGFVDQPLLAYRQHGDNSVGARKYLSFANAKKVFHIDTMIHTIDRDIQQLGAYVKYRNGFLVKKNDIPAKFYWAVRDRRYVDALQIGVKKQGTLRNFLFKIYLFFYMSFCQREM